jgi:hypothetical protein
MYPWNSRRIDLDHSPRVLLVSGAAGATGKEPRSLSRLVWVATFLCVLQHLAGLRVDADFMCDFATLNVEGVT